MQIEAYQDAAGGKPFEVWFDELDLHAAPRITKTLTRMGLGNLGDVKSVGGGVIETRIDYGPGYRLYMGRDGETLVILLAGGTKRRQKADIKAAQIRWDDYKARKRKIGGGSDPKFQRDR